MEILSHQFNTAFPDATNKLRVPKITRGIAVECFFGNEDATFELQWGNRHGSDRAKYVGADDSTYIQGLKYRFNALGMGVSFKTFENARLGIMMDFGRFTLFQKYASKEVYGSKEWEYFHNERKKAKSIGFRFYMEFTRILTPGVSLGIRPYIMLMWETYHQMENDLKRNYYEVSNFGVTLNLSLYKTKEE